MAELGSGPMTYEQTTSATFNAMAVVQTDIDSFRYTNRDAQGATSTATVMLAIGGSSDGPRARDKTSAADADTLATGNIRTDNTGAGTDSDPDSGETATLTVSAVNGVAGNVGRDRKSVV